MSDVNMLDFPVADSTYSSDWVGISQGGVNMKISMDNFIAALNGGNPFTMTVKTESTTDRVLTPSDRNSYIRCTNPAITTLVVGPVSDWGWKLHDSIVGRRAGDGNVQIVGTGGVVVNPSSSGNTTSSQGQTFQLICIDDTGYGEWDLIMG